MTTPVKVVWSNAKETRAGGVVHVPTRFVDAATELELAAETEDLLEEMRDEQKLEFDHQAPASPIKDESATKIDVKEDGGDDEMKRILNESKAMDHAEEEDDDDDVVEEVVSTLLHQTPTKGKRTTSNKRPLPSPHDDEEENDDRIEAHGEASAPLLFGLEAKVATHETTHKRRKTTKSDRDSVWILGGAPSFVPVASSMPSLNNISDASSSNEGSEDAEKKLRESERQMEKEREAFEKSFTESFVWSRLYT